MASGKFLVNFHETGSVLGRGEVTTKATPGINVGSKRTKARSIAAELFSELAWTPGLDGMDPRLFMGQAFQLRRIYEKLPQWVAYNRIVKYNPRS